MKKGIIMEIGDAYLTLLTPEGEFLRTNKQDQIYTIGEEINFFPLVNVQQRKSLFLLLNIFATKPVWAVVAALFILLGSFIPMFQNNKAYAYMSIDSNSSIELGVNNKMQVVKLTGLNKAGKETITELHKWKNEDVAKITQEILAEINPTDTNQPVIISTVAAKERDEQSEKKLQKDINEIKAVASKKEIALKVIKATTEERKKARNLGISTGKYKQRINQSPQKEIADQQSTTTTSPKSVVLPPVQQKKKNEKPVITNSVNEKKAAGQITPIVKAIPPGQLKKENNQIEKKPVSTNTRQPSKQEAKPKHEQNSKPIVKQKNKKTSNSPNKTKAKSKPAKPQQKKTKQKSNK